MNNGIKISEICNQYRLQYKGNDIEFEGMGFCDRPSQFKSILSFASSDKYVSTVADNKSIVCLIIKYEFKDAYSVENIGRKVTLIFSLNPEIIFYKIHEQLCERKTFYKRYDFVPIIGRKCNIAKSAVIEDGVIIGNNVTIGSNTVVRSGSIIDDNTTIGCNTIIGSEGFQLITDSEGAAMHITHVGRCHIGSDVYVGDNTCICNSLFDGETYIGDGAKIDNLVQISHNIYVGKKAVITAHVILCGSSRIEDGAWIAPNSSVLNRVVIGKGAKVGLGSVVTRDVAPHAVVYGSPAKVHEKSEF